MKQYKNYIFDFYGTLVDIKTDEESLVFWKKIAEVYSHFGADYTPKELKKTYIKFVKEEEKKLIEKHGYKYPEIELKTVFVRLLTEAKKKHKTKNTISDLNSWADHIATFFRVESRDYIKPYPDTIETLTELKKRGAKVYLLSNAQRCFTQAELEITGIEPLLDDAFLSSDYEIRKPEPAFLQRLMEKHNMKKEGTVMVGNDTTADINMPQMVGIDAVLINTFKFTKKYIKDTCKEEPLIITRIKELLF